MAYPSLISALTNPLSTDRLNSPSHSGVEQAQNTNITAIQTFMGVEGPSSTVGTLIYDVRSPGSSGGGHVQTAVLGGTGQVTYTKGDVLIAQSASVLGKLSVGADGQILKANSSVAAGINWVDNTSNKVATNTSVFVIPQSGEYSILTVSIPGSTLGTSNAVRTTAYLTNVDVANNSRFMARILYGGGYVTSIVGTGAAQVNATGYIRNTIIANNSTALQRHIVEMVVESTPSVLNGSRNMVIATSSVNSTANQNVGMTMEFGIGNGASVWGYVVEKIV